MCKTFASLILDAFRHHTEKFCSNVLYSGCTVQDLYSLAATSSCTTVYSQNNMAVSLGIVFCNKKSEITMFSFWKVSIMWSEEQRRNGKSFYQSNNLIVSNCVFGVNALPRIHYLGWLDWMKFDTEWGGTNYLKSCISILIVSIASMTIGIPTCPVLCLCWRAVWWNIFIV